MRVFQALPRNGSTCHNITLHSVLGNGSTLPLELLQATIEEILDASLAVRALSYQEKVEDSCLSICVSTLWHDIAVTHS
jgi:hypothetical protein